MRHHHTGGVGHIRVDAVIANAKGACDPQVRHPLQEVSPDTVVAIGQHVLNARAVLIQPGQRIVQIPDVHPLQPAAGERLAKRALVRIRAGHLPQLPGSAVDRLDTRSRPFAPPRAQSV